jgi:hypothetical protein
MRPLILMVLFTAGCAAVKPWDRDDHARRCMTARFSDDGLGGHYRAKTAETKTGGGVAWAVAGGGCGCSQ